MAEAASYQQVDKFLKNLTKKTAARPLITRLIKTASLPDLTKNL